MAMTAGQSEWRFMAGGYERGRTRVRTHLGRIACIVAACTLLFPTTISAQTSGPRVITTEELTRVRSGDKDWITYGGSIYNQRFSSLDQINTGNVQELKGAWLTRLGSGRGSKYRFEADPMVVDGTMYIPTGNDDIFALNAKTGQKIWSWESDIPQVNDLVCCGWDNRGVAVADGMVLSGLLDASFVALDQKTGKQLWRTQLEDYHNGYSITGAFRYYDGLVFTGMSGGENGVRGRVYALDAKTGKEVWRFYTVPGPDDIGGDSWPAGSDVYTHGGATVWQAVTIDPELGMLYFSTGNAGPWEGSLRPGDSLFSSSIVALDYKTGQYKWHFQQVHHDLWDYDNPSPTLLFDTVQNGTPRKALVECAKTAWCYFLDRTNGTPLIGIDEKPVPQEPRQTPRQPSRTRSAMRPPRSVASPPKASRWSAASSILTGTFRSSSDHLGRVAPTGTRPRTARRRKCCTRPPTSRTARSPCATCRTNRDAAGLASPP